MRSAVENVSYPEVLETDWLVIGGGAAGIMAAVRARELAPTCRVMVLEKANVTRSGCLAAGINAINAYLNPGETAASFLQYVKKEFAQQVRDDLVLSLAERLNEMTDRLAAWGLPIYRDEQGRYRQRGRASIQINGEAIKPLMAAALEASGAEVRNHAVVTDLIVTDGRVAGALYFDLHTGQFTAVRAKAVLIATGGASGIYQPNTGGAARHKQWYSPFNAGSGWAMALRAGAELTSLEMRFIALRVAHTMAPTGTIAQGVKAKQINGDGVNYVPNYAYAQGKPTTAELLWATMEEEKAGRGPCALDTRGLTPEQGDLLAQAYLCMCPTQVLQWADAEQRPETAAVPITGSEPYLVGGHGTAGLWVDVHRQTTIAGLYGAGDAVGGAPKKYVTGSMAEGAIAAEHALDHFLREAAAPHPGWTEALEQAWRRARQPLNNDAGATARQVEEALQAVMEYHAGGRSGGYRYEQSGIERAQQSLAQLSKAGAALGATTPYELMRVHEVRDRLLVAAALLVHQSHRRESRLPLYQSRTDYPAPDPQLDRTWLNTRRSHGRADADEELKLEILERVWEEAVPREQASEEPVPEEQAPGESAVRGGISA
ncbi:adenylyl-sulfate reductase subunit alpha [Heliophilum fasciatum]|uniref:Dissimilatory adenylylsulfate reductase alpha subunit n=1 Tax=Heliophilum fasciatum TaxID=35700 RepID=A0A4R2RYQ4_9FIRM|nr:adenylyl-sulfate reductase subunit alpha [Heliophilum fasciatum]MCW2276796.1 adenylylsulfate reductase subunit A [Heliophilum fasciatum]TCP68743.1 dissimilatory adenylylsulfate reductase alpha subunit precursor [Heliophilum fasciatum]